MCWVGTHQSAINWPLLNRPQSLFPGYTNIKHPLDEVNGFAGSLAPTTEPAMVRDLYRTTGGIQQQTNCCSAAALNYDKNLPTAGFIGSCSPGNPPYPGTNAGVSFPLGFAGAGQSTDTISDVVINKQYLLAGGHPVVSDSGSDGLAIDNTLSE